MGFTPEQFISFLGRVEKLKSVPRHCVTSDGVTENVAAHSWRTALMAYLLKDELADVDIDKIIRMCLIHDLGEAVTGDIPTFEKTAAHEATEAQAVEAWLHALPADVGPRLTALLAEYEAQETQEARLVKALDKMEALIQHNESPIETWLPLEYQLNLTYGQAQTDGDPYLKGLRAAINAVTREKIAREAPTEAPHP